MSARERTSWRWEYGVRRQDGAILTSPQPEYPWNQNEATRCAEELKVAARRVGEKREAVVIRRKRTTVVRTEIGGWRA